MNKRNKDIIITGFALFAMFFGAGNLIFPPFLGLISGSSWLTGFTGFILADVGLSLLAILAIAKCDGDVGKIFSRAGHKISLVLACSIMICIGPLLA
ncbi:branched-chain amino acid transport system II carrier protein, partial [Clostridioides difficile]